MTKHTIVTEFQNEFETCPACGYSGGFHSIFRQDTGSDISWLLRCPSCHETYDIGLRTRMQSGSASQ
jgi:transposase-like protein